MDWTGLDWTDPFPHNHRLRGGVWAIKSTCAHVSNVLSIMVMLSLCDRRVGSLIRSI